MRMLRSNVLLKPSTQKEHVSGLIITTQAASNEGTVLGIGPDVKELAVGDKVKYDPNSVVKLDDLLMCREADVLCVIE